MPLLLRRLCLMLGRLCLSAWVGGAALFVIDGVRQVQSAHFDSTIKGHLALIRFPAYYVFGFTLVLMTLGCLLLSGRPAGSSKWRWRIPIGCVIAALVLMVVDYQTIYLPLAEMLSPLDQPRPQSFVVLHERSRQINAAHVGLCLIAAMLLCWPGTSHDTAATKAE